MLINAHPYRQVLSDRRAVAFSLAGFVARLPMSMTGIGIVLLVSLTTGSFGLAGSLTAAATVTWAVVAPLWGRATDRVGQARVLIVTVLINVLSVALLVSAIELGWPLPVSFVGAVGINRRDSPQINTDRGGCAAGGTRHFQRGFNIATF